MEKGTLAWIPLEHLRPNSWNPNVMDPAMFEKETASIQRFGMAAPIVARESGDGFEIIDGENRLTVLQMLGHREAPVWNLGEVPDADAKQLTIVLNETRGSAEKTKLAALLQDLLKSETTTDLLEVLPFSKEAFAEMTNLPAFDWESFEKPQNPTAGRTWVERVFRMPPDAAQVLDQAIAVAQQSGSDQRVEDWAALELIAKDYLDG